MELIFKKIVYNMFGNKLINDKNLNLFRFVVIKYGDINYRYKSTPTSGKKRKKSGIDMT